MNTRPSVQRQRTLQRASVLTFILCTVLAMTSLSTYVQAQHAKVLHTIKGPEGIFLFRAFSPDGQSILTTANNQVTLWDTKTGKELLKIDIPNNEGSVTFSPDGTKLLAATQENLAKIWDASSGKELFTLKGHKAQVIATHYFPDGKKILTLDSDGVGKIWDARTGESLYSTLKDTAIQPAVFSANGHFATRSTDNKVIIWNAEGIALAELKGHKSTILSMAFSPDGTYLITGAKDNTAKIWNTSTGQKVSILPHADFVSFVAYSPDAKHIVTRAWNHLLTIWDARTNKELFTIQDVAEPITYSPNGQTLLLAPSAGGRAKMVDAHRGTELATFDGLHFIQSLAYSPSGQRLAIGSNREIIVWALEE